MAYVCAKRDCENHVPVPANMPQDVSHVRLVNTEDAHVRPAIFGPVRDLGSRLVVRHLWQKDNMFGDRFWLCDECHERRSK